LKKQLLLCALLVIITAFLTSCKSEVIESDGTITMPNDLAISDEKTTKMPAEEYYEKYGTAELLPENGMLPEYDKVKPVNKFSGKDSVDYKTVSYSDIKIEKSKELLHGITLDDLCKELPKEAAGYDSVLCDSNGTLTSDFTYLYMVAKVKNNFKNDRILCITHDYFVLDSDSNAIDPDIIIDTLPVYVTQFTAEKAKKDYYKETYKTNETKEVTSIWVVADEYINSKSLCLLMYNEIPEIWEVDNLKDYLEDGKYYMVNE
jgi:hypothetical protein